MRLAGAIDSGDDPPLPELLAKKHGGENGQHAGEIIEPDDVEHVQDVVMTREQAVPSGMGRCNCEAIRAEAWAQGSFFIEAASLCNAAI